MIDLLALDSVQISRNLKGKFLLIYGAPKVGKTTLLSKLPKSLILAFEPGANALNNAHVQPIKKWTDFKVVLKQLHNPAVQEKFHFIGIDTADSAWDMCEKYVCAQNDVKAISDIPWGKGYSECQKEFSQAFFDLAILQYGICFISHESEKRFKDEQGEEYVQLVPALPTRPYDIVNKLDDLTTYCHYELSKLNMNIYTHSENGNGVLSFNIPSFHSNDVASFLDEKFSICTRSGYHCAGKKHESLNTLETGTVRVSFSYFNSFNDIQKLIAGVKSFLVLKEKEKNSALKIEKNKNLLKL